MADPVSSLRTALDQQAKATCNEALQNGGQISADRVEAIRRLQRLVEIAEGAPPAPTRARWVLPAVLVTSLIVASIMLFVHLRQAEVEADVAVSELAFRLDTETALAPGMNLASIGVSGPQKIEVPELPASEGHPEKGLSEVSRISLRGPEKDGGSITLPSFQLPAGTMVRIQTTARNTYRVTLNVPKGTSIEFPLSCQGRVQVALSGVPAKQYQFAVPVAFVSRTASEETVLDLTFPENATLTLTPQLPVSDVSFVHLEQNANRTGVRYLSTIFSGDLYLDSLNGEKRALRSGEGLRFESSQGEMRRISLQAAPISAQFQGSVRGMTTGSRDTRVDLMPSLLEWLRARHGLYLLWGTALYLFGILGSVLRWFHMME